MNREYCIVDGLSTSQPPAIDPALLESEDVFAVLAHLRRRFLLYALDTDDQSTLSALTRKLAAWEHDIDEAAVNERLYDRMYISLSHTHIPKLDEVDAIQFDEREETISPGAHTEDLLAVLDGVSANLEQQ